jgi:hypothetical protein
MSGESGAECQKPAAQGTRHVPLATMASLPCVLPRMQWQRDRVRADLSSQPQTWLRRNGCAAGALRVSWAEHAHGWLGREIFSLLAHVAEVGGVGEACRLVRDGR